MRRMLRTSMSALAGLLLLAAAAPAQEPAARQGRVVPARPVSTYSVVARDSATGRLGVAVQSHWFSVGSVVPWARAGVGAVATQSFTDPSYGSLGLRLLEIGRSPERALAGLVEADPSPEVRQVGMVDDRGRVAVHTGERAIPHACHRTGDGFTVQANLMHRPGVCDAMHRAYRSHGGDLAARLVAALHAAQEVGGDIRGKQSAALLVVAAEATGRPWADRIYDLRVEDAPDPLAELERLLRVARAYRHMNEGDEAVTEGEIERAVRSYRRAEELLPDRAEPPFWHAVNLVNAGRVEEALPLFAEAFRRHPPLRELVGRLPEAGLLPDEPSLLERIRSAGGS